MITELAAGLYTVSILGVIAFQIALIAGAPWGHLTQGGKHEGALPTKGRITAAVSIPVLLLMTAGVLSSAGIGLDWPAWPGWAALGFQALTTVANWATPSRAERRLWGPVNTVLLLLAVYLVVFSS